MIKAGAETNLKDNDDRLAIDTAPDPTVKITTKPCNLNAANAT